MRSLLHRRLLASSTISALATSLLFGLVAPVHAAEPAPAASASAAPTSTAPSLRAEKRKLSNGLEVILHEDHRTPLATVNVWYHVGSKDEAPKRSGFAHLFEHLMFQGSRHVPEDTFFRFLESVGGTSVNGTTNTDRTNYFETVPSNQLELALWLESDRMAFLLDHVDQKTFDSQRLVVKNERRQSYENAPYGYVHKFISEALFPESHPYHHLTIGTPEDLDNASLDDVRAFFRQYYTPSNATLVLSGDFDRDKAFALVEKYFGPIAARPKPAPTTAPIPTLSGETKIHVEAGVQLPRVTVAWVTPPFFQAGDAELDLLAHVLTGGKSSRLYKRLVYDMQIAQSVHAYQGSSMLASRFEIVATAKPGKNPEEILRVIDEELARVRSEGITEAEFARAKTSLVSSLLLSTEKSSEIADRLNMYNHHVGDPNWLERDVARVKNATREGTVEMAKKWIRERDRVVALVNVNKDAPLAGRIVRSERGGR